MGRILCLDLGQKRIGMAMTDAMGSMAFPLGTINRTQPERDLAAILSLVSEEKIETIVLGLPLTLKGEQGQEAQAAQLFREELAEKTGLPVEMWDERLSTAAAERAMVEAGVKREKRRQARDTVAATIILQGYLDNKKRQQRAGETTERGVS